MRAASGQERKCDMNLVVIIPTVRVDKWLGEAVSSVLNQIGIEPHVVVVHDGVAPDYSVWWMSDPRVTAVHSVERIGLPGVLVKAIAETTEPYIARLDADDIAAPGRLAEQLSYLELHPETVLVGTQGFRINEFGQVTGEISTVVGPDIRSALLERNRLIHPSVVFRRDSYLLAGGFDTRLRVMEDYELWMRMATVGPVAVLASRSIFYRVHPGQMSRGAKPYGLHIDKTLSSHRLLARALNVNFICASVQELKWSAAQYLRYWNLRKRSFDR